MKPMTAPPGKDKRYWFMDSLEQKMLCKHDFLSASRCREELVHSMNLQRKKIDLLQLLLHNLRFVDNAYQKKPIKACLSAQEMRKHNLHFRMVHGSKNSAKEKRLLKEIKGSQKLDDDEEYSFASFWNQLEEDLASITKYNRCYGKYQIWWLQHQMPFLINKGDTKDREKEIRELQWKIESCGVVLLKKTDKTPTTVNATPTLVKGKTVTSFLGSKKPLQEQIKLAGKEIEESRKTLQALGPELGEAKRKLVGVQKEINRITKERIARSRCKVLRYPM